MDQLGAVAGKQYQGDGLSVIATPDGASLRCAFQRLEGQVTREGLWLSSTADNNSGESFRVRAASVGRTDDFNFGELFPLNYVAADVRRLKLPDAETQTPDLFRASLRRLLQFDAALPPTGLVSVTDNMARFIRPGLTEEYTVSVDGVRQDFIIEQRPEGDGELRVELDVTGAKAEPLVNGVCLVLDGSGRKLAYNRLRVTDATGRELPARMELTADTTDLGRAGSPLPADGAHGVTRPTLAVLVDDAAAIYPVRIDRTFSDADWISMGSGLNGQVGVIVASGSNLYAGGRFTRAGDISATNVATWNGSEWSALGAGVNGEVWALAVLGTNLYAGGKFTTAGGNNANFVAKWDGAVWSALGSGMNSYVGALAVSGTNLYAGGWFTTAGGSAANRIAKLEGMDWLSLGTGMNGYVSTVVAAGDDVYVGGGFTMAGDNSANCIAKWDGSSWSALGSGVGGGSFGTGVSLLAVSGTNLYAGGRFTVAGGNAATNIAKWDGSTWSALGTGINTSHPRAGVGALAVSGSDVFVGGVFTTADGNAANFITKWDGSSWSALGSGVNGLVDTLAVSGSDLYVGGTFTTAGGKQSTNIAKLIGPAVFTSIVLNHSGAEALLTYTSAPGAALHLLSSPDMITWQTNTTVAAASESNSITVNVSHPQEFFRLRRLP